MENYIQTTYDAANRVWRGLQVPRTISGETSFGEAILKALLKNPTKIGQICHHNGKMYSNKELAALSISVAKHFSKLGLQQGDVIGLCAFNSDFVAPLFFGAMLHGLIVSTWSRDSRNYSFEMSKPKLMFCDGDIFERVKSALKECGLNTKMFTMNEHIEGQLSIKEFLTNTTDNFDYSFEPLKLGVSQTAVILYSSGTTGPPKGVILSKEDLLSVGDFKQPPEEPFLCFAGLNWISGLNTLVRCTFSGLTRIIIDKAFSCDAFFDIIEKYRPAMFFSPPSQMALMLASPKIKTTDLSCIKIYSCGGSAVPYVLVKQLKAYMPNAKFYNVYGLTEVPSRVALGEIDERIGRIGGIVPNMQIKIINDVGEKLGPNEIGEFYLKTNRKWLGYYHNEKATKAVLDDEGWFATADLGYIDEQGILYLVDRKIDALIYDKIPYFPTEIELVIRELQDVVEVSVCGLSHASSSYQTAAAIVKKIGSSLTEKDVYDHVARRLDHFKHLKGGVYFLDSMPLTHSGKVERKEVKKICEQLRNEANNNNI